ncbi:MAG TPA: FAD-dependent oxidoreductase [Solirubrobacterales bacterium]|nr:FAD-dependent oxidoreductase [Solirubrobacterales bacterium]
MAAVHREISNRSTPEPAGARPEPEAFRVVIAGAGVAALEAILALREAVGDRAEITLLAPDAELFHRPLATLAPFRIDGTRAIPLTRLADDLDFTHHRDRLAGIDAPGRVVTTVAGTELRYDALLVAIGARAESAIPGAITYSGPASAGELETVLDSIRSETIGRLAFAIPPVARWSLPVYELAVLTGRYARRHGLSLESTIATHEHAPLELFGERPSEGVRQLLAIEGIELRAGAAPVAARGGALRLANGDAIAADAVLALPRFVAPPIPGLPQGPAGFVPTDAYMRVDGLDRVWAVGDITWFPIKQGGLATQQADAAASSIARAIDPELTARPFAPVLRAALTTGWTPYYLRASMTGAGEPAASKAPLWWPPSKVAGRLLGSYLAEHDGDHLPPPLEDLDDPVAEGSEREADHLDALELALTAADLDARAADYEGALRWLDVAERLNLTLPDAYSGKRDRWRAQQLIEHEAAP